MDCEQVAPLYEEYALGVLEPRSARKSKRIWRATVRNALPASRKRAGSSRNSRMSRPKRSLLNR